jgi:hypothetical protein
VGGYGESNAWRTPPRPRERASFVSDPFGRGQKSSLSEYLPLVPDRSDEFLTLLLAELKVALISGWEFRSDGWGRLWVENGELILSVIKPEEFDDPDFEPSVES